MLKSMPTVFAASVLLAACQTPLMLDDARARRATKVEAQFDADGRPVEIEYHVLVEEVPQVVLDAWKRLYPQLTPTAAEFEQRADGVTWELIADENGRARNVMFRPDGSVHLIEIEIPASDAPATLAALERTWPGAKVTEVLRVRDGSSTPIGHQVEFEHEGRALKAWFDEDSRVLWAVREMPAEVEVPVDVPGRTAPR